jgi:putative membrane protein
MLMGGLAGLVATLPMTAAMEAMFRWLPRREQYALPPGEITAKLTDELGVNDQMDVQQHLALTLFNHFAYGAAAGSLYGVIVDAVQGKAQLGPPAIQGSVWGIIVWTVSYLGLLPALGVLRPATQHPGRRNLLMISAHLIWGSVLGILTERWRHT